MIKFEVAPIFIYTKPDSDTGHSCYEQMDGNLMNWSI